MSASPARRKARLLPVEIPFLAYLAASTGVLIAAHGSIPQLPLLIGVRVALALFLALCLSGRLPRRLSFLRDWYLLLLTPVFYSEVGSLNRAFTSGYFDARVLRWEFRMFGSQPSIVLRERLPQRWLSEYLHFAYLSYYLIPLIPAVALYARGRLREFRLFVGTVGVAFFGCMLIFIAFPVRGPFYVFTPPDPHALGRFMPPLVHWVLHRGSSVGTAFPSSHVAVSATALLAAYRYQRACFWILLALVPALAVGAVYGGFHYAIDVVSGAALAVLIAAAAPPLLARAADSARGAPAAALP